MTKLIFKAPTILLFMLIGVLFFSCNKDDDTAKQAELDEQAIVDYLAENNIEANRHETGLYYKIIKEGSGLQPLPQSSVEVYYKGYLRNGSVFDETTQGPVIFPLSSMIKGWQVALPLLKKGGRGLFLIPSNMGYGSDGVYGIPPNSVLIFEIDLVDVF